MMTSTETCTYITYVEIYIGMLNVCLKKLYKKIIQFLLYVLNVLKIFSSRVGDMSYKADHRSAVAKGLCLENKF